MLRDARRAEEGSGHHRAVPEPHRQTHRSGVRALGFDVRREPLADATPAVYVADLRKTFSVPVREAGLTAAAKSLVRRESREIKAVDGVSFDIDPGEVVGFLGPERRRARPRA
jgi:ABC-type glutathione transport system ATPase component